MANALSAVRAAVSSALSSLSSLAQVSEAERIQLLGVLDQLRVAIEPPVFSLQRLCFSAQALPVVKVAMDMGVFDAFVASGGAEMTARELHAKCKGDQQLLVRVMRVLCGQMIVQEVGKEKYKPLPLAMMLATGGPPAAAITHFDLHSKLYTSFPEYFKANGYKNPQDAYQSPFQLALKTDRHYFDWVYDDPEQRPAFNTVMTMGRAMRGQDWFDYYPVEEKMQTSPEKIVIVDIGGGVGHDISSFKKRFPQLPGRMILEDLPQVIDDINEPLPVGVEAIKYDMFKPQPIKGARVYYLRTVIHDWPDKQALIILANIRDAMDQDSILILSENLLPEIGATAYAAGLDLTMMASLSSLERTEQQWLDLLDIAGFRVKVWKPTVQGIGATATFEGVLK